MCEYIYVFLSLREKIIHIKEKYLSLLWRITERLFLLFIL